VIVTSDMTSALDAKVIGVSVAVGASVSVGVGVSVGIAVARNFIGWDPSGTGFQADRSSTSTPQQLIRGQTVRVVDGARRGDVYEFLGDQPPAKYTDSEPERTGPEHQRQSSWSRGRNLPLRRCRQGGRGVAGRRHAALRHESEWLFTPSVDRLRWEYASTDATRVR